MNVHSLTVVQSSSKLEYDMRQPSRRQVMKLLAGAPMLPLGGTAAASLLAAFGSASPAVAGSAGFVSAKFSAMPAPTLADAAAMATTTVGSTMTVNFSDSSKPDFKLAYQPFFITGDMVADGKGGTHPRRRLLRHPRPADRRRLGAGQGAPVLLRFARTAPRC